MLIPVKGCKNGDKIFSIFPMISGANGKIIAENRCDFSFPRAWRIFVKKCYYGVCYNLIYFNDAVNDTRDILGAE